MLPKVKAGAFKVRVKLWVQGLWPLMVMVMVKFATVPSATLLAIVIA